VAVAPSAEVRVPSQTRIIDASGKYLIPGLWDMHVHIYDERQLPLFTANGVTGVRQIPRSREALAEFDKRTAPSRVLRVFEWRELVDAAVGHQ
jgi:predicted amidohydrolase YtcJ